MNESANFSNIHKFYDFINSLTTLGFDKSWRKQAADKLNPGNVLDLGSGTGASYSDLKNFDVTALDPDKQMLSLNNLKKKLLVKVKSYLLTKIHLIMFYVVSYGEMLTIQRKHLVRSTEYLSLEVSSYCLI